MTPVLDSIVLTVVMLLFGDVRAVENSQGLTNVLDVDSRGRS